MGVGAWGCTIQYLDVQLSGNTCFQQLFCVNLGSLSGLKIRNIFKDVGFQSSYCLLSLQGTELGAPVLGRGGRGVTLCTDSPLVSPLDFRPTLTAGCTAYSRGLYSLHFAVYLLHF